MPFETVQSETVFRGRAFHVRKDHVRLPDGQVTQLDIVEHKGAVTLIPIDDEGYIWFVRQYRHAAGVDLLELPAGSLESGEQPEACAAREIREEIGMRAGKLHKLGGFFMAPGYSTEFLHIFLATDLSPDPLPRDQDEFLSIERIHQSELDGMVQRGVIQDGKTLAGIFLLRQLAPFIT